MALLIMIYSPSDNKIAVREGTMKVLTQMMETISPGPVLEVVIHRYAAHTLHIRCTYAAHTLHIRCTTKL